MARDDLIEVRTTKLSGAFGHYVRVYDERVPFTGEQLAAHRECIRLRREAGSVRAAVDDERFEKALLRTLRAWGIGVRASEAGACRGLYRCVACGSSAVGRP